MIIPPLPGTLPRDELMMIYSKVVVNSLELNLSLTPKETK